MTRYAFTVFVTGETARSKRAVSNLRSVCERLVPGDYELSIVDVLVDTQTAEDHNIIATPTVLRTRPEPERRVLGDLSDLTQVATALDIGDDLTPGGRI